MRRSVGKPTFILIIIFLLALRAGGQAPGYMGKKTTFGYGLYFNPAFSNVLMDYSDSPLNTQHEFFVEQVVGRSPQLGLSLKFYRYTYNNIDKINWDKEVYGIHQGGLARDEHPRGTYRIKARNYSFYSRFFNKRYVAPWGKYFLLGITVYDYKAQYDPEQMKARSDAYVYSNILNRYYAQEQYVNDFGPTTQQYYTADLVFGNGRSRIFFDRIVWDYGYIINTISMFRYLAMMADKIFSTYPVDGYGIEDYIKKTSLRRVSALNRFNFYMKIGYLF